VDVLKLAARIRELEPSEVRDYQSPPPTREEIETARIKSRACLDTIRIHARDLADGRVAPYAAGREIWSTAMAGGTGPSPEGDYCEGLWMLWGALTDWVENKPEEEAQAEEAMRRAARQWLDVGDDARGRHQYLVRWLYEEMGYERPDHLRQPGQADDAATPDAREDGQAR
jgi:hypothetical protein